MWVQEQETFGDGEIAIFGYYDSEQYSQLY